MRTARFGSFCRALAYTLPPQPQKASFLGVSAAGIVAAVSQKELPVAEALIKTTGGVGRWFAREAAYRAFGGRDVTASRMTEQEKAALLEAVAFVQAAYADGGTRWRLWWTGARWNSAFCR